MVIVFDLDDTLFAEMDFVRSAYRRIARIYGHELLDSMLNAATPREAFDSTGLPIEELLMIYRSHEPDILLPWQSLFTLAALKNRGHTLGLITDGRSLTQRNKLRALGLERFISPDMIFISEEIGADKLSGEAFRRIIDTCGVGETYMYVGDNPKKDFIVANCLGWQTVCLLNGVRGENIFSQDFKQFPEEYWPKILISQLTDLLGFDNLK